MAGAGWNVVYGVMARKWLVAVHLIPETWAGAQVGHVVGIPALPHWLSAAFGATFNRLSGST